MKKIINIALVLVSLSGIAQTKQKTTAQTEKEEQDLVRVGARQYTITSNKSSDNTKNTDVIVPATPSISPELERLVDEITNPKLPFTLSGYLDAYYLKNLNNPKNSSNTGLSGSARAFDQKENQFQIGLAQTKFTWNSSKCEAVIDLTFGPHADLGNYGNKIGPLGINVGSTALCIKQSYITYKANKKNSFTLGQFGTHIGYEVIEASVNYHYSLSNLFNNGPFYHQGFKYTHTFNDKWNATLGLVNNWDNLYDNNRFKTAIWQLNYSPKPGYSFYLNYIGGKENDTKDSLQNLNFYDKISVNYFKQLLDLVVSLQVNQKLNIGLNAAIGSKSILPPRLDTIGRTLIVNNWGGAALYANYAINTKIQFGIRAEIFDNTSGIQYIGKTDVKSLTGTFVIKLQNDLLFKPEFRMDIYKLNASKNGVIQSQQFMDNTGNYNRNSQITIGAALIKRF